MSQDIISDGLNMIRNAIRARKTSVKLTRISGLLIEILKIMKSEGVIKGYKINSKEKSLDVSFGNISECRSIKPRFTVQINQIEKYIRRYLPARNLGIVIISTNKGLMTHKQAQEEKIGGCLIAYFW